jgi:glycosyltransferase involved in cell wall biosynthesis
VVARGVDTQLFHPDKRDPVLRQIWSADEDGLVLLYAGRLAAEKNLDVVVKTYEALKSSGTKLSLVFAGDGPYADTLRDQCPDAIFMGMCDQQKLSQIYASADVFLFPSLTETFGNVTLEALSSGTPVLAFNCAAAAELLLHNVNGWLVDGDCDADFVKTACESLKNRSSVRSMRETTRLSAEAMDWNVIAQQVEEVFLKVLNEYHQKIKS